MHIPSSMMDGAVCPITAVASVIGISCAAVAAVKSKETPGTQKFAAVSAFVFAAQMVNFPVISGSSGHLLGGLLAAACLGVPFGVLAISLVVTLQCLIFADGGLSVLGANLWNMAILGAGGGGLLWRFLSNHWTGAPKAATIAVAAWVSVMLAALGCSLELAASGAAAFSKVVPAMLGMHAWIGIGESLITVCLVAWLSSPARQASRFQPERIMMLAACLCACVLAPFACSWPDGLESVAAQLNFLHASSPVFVAPLPDYNVPQISNAFFSTSFAGAIGCVLTYAAALTCAGIRRKMS